MKVDNRTILLLVAVLVLTTRKKDGAVQKTSMQPEVPAKPTPTTAADVASVLVSAYTTVRGDAPPARESWAWPHALSANETAEWSQVWNYNIGNVTTDGRDPWYSNPHVTAALRFRAFESLTGGAVAMLQILNRFGGLDAADRGDFEAFQAACDKYLGSTYPRLDQLVAKYKALVPREGVRS